MFARVRRRLTVQYVGLTAAILLVVAAAIAGLTAAEIRRVDDLELRLRAERLARDLARANGSLDAPAGPADRVRRDRDRDHDDDDDHDDERRPEALGMLAYTIAPDGSQSAALTDETVPGLPDVPAAQAALRAGGGQYSTLATPGGDLRVYSLPVQRDGQPVAVVQVARSAYFASQTITRQLLAVGGLSAAGLLALAGAGYWLAGRAMQPVAAAFQRQRDFVADASHELRTPLALLRANAEMLARHPEQRIGDNLDLVGDILSETDRLGRLVADLLTLARADAGTVQIAREPVALSELAAALAADMKPLAAAKGLALDTAIAPGITVRGDRDRLRQLGLILLDNAIRYTQAGSVTVRLREERGEAVLSVEDTGPGIGPEHLPHIFERFYRSDAARSAEVGGAGLGLAIAQWIAGAHGGVITATSVAGRGSVFTVRLPTVPSPV